MQMESHSVPLQCYYGFQFQLSQKLVIIAQNGGQGPDKHETSKKKYIWGGTGPQGAVLGRFHGAATKIIENLNFESIKAYFFCKYFVLAP